MGAAAGKRLEAGRFAPSAGLLCSSFSPDDGAGRLPPSRAAGGSLAGRGDGRPGARILKSGKRGGKGGAHSGEGRSFGSVCGNETAVGCGQRTIGPSGGI